MSFGTVRRFACWFLLASLACLLAACGGGAGGSTTTTSPTSGDTLSVTMTLPDGTVGNRFPVGTSASVTVKLLRGGSAKTPIAGARIAFSATPAVATIGLPSGQTLTDAQGTASTTLTGVAQGVDVLSITATYTDSTGAQQTLTATPTYEVLQGSVVVTPQPTMTLALDTGSSVVSGGQSNLSATVLDTAGKPVQGALVTFSNDTSYAVFNPDSGTALTDASGVARIGIIGTSKLGADKVTATASTPGSSGVSTTISASLNYQVTAASSSSPQLSLSLTVNGSSATSLSQRTDGLITAVFADATGKPIPNAIVTFDIASGGAGASVGLSALSAVTDAQGHATTSVLGTDTNNSGAVTVEASASSGKLTALGSLVFNYAPRLPSIKSLVVNLPAGATTLPASSSTTVVATLVDASSGAPYTDPTTVNFTTACAQASRASISVSAVSINGQATATYTDLGCGSVDTITATVGNRTLSTNVNISPAQASAMTFVDVNPATLGIKGSGTGEVGTVRFRLVDASGNGVSGQTVKFALSTTVGGISLNTTSAVTDASGYASALVQSGTIGTPLTVTATLSGNTAIWAQSRQLYVSTKIPHQNGFSLAASSHNPEFYDVDGQTVNLTVRVSDRFGLPVPDGTQINFRTEGGIGTIQDPNNATAPVGGCITSSSTCSVTLTSSGDRTRLSSVAPLSTADGGRQTVMAFAVGEDSFDDNNGNGVFDTGDVFPPAANAGSYRQGEAYIDANESGTRDSTEEYVDYNNNGSYDAPDGKYRGIGCAHPSLCATDSSHVPIPTRLVFDRNVIVWSGSVADFSQISLGSADVDQDTVNATQANLGSGNAVISFGATAGHGGCTDGQAVLILFPITDGRTSHTGAFNPMPSGTIVTVSTTNGAVDAASSTFTVPDTITAPVMGITLSSDATYDTASAACANTVASGVLTIKVATPRGITSTYNIAVHD